MPNNNLPFVPVTILASAGEIEAYLKDLLLSLNYQKDLGQTFTISVELGIHGAPKKLKPKIPKGLGFPVNIYHLPAGLGYGQKQNMLFAKIQKRHFEKFLMLNPDMVLHSDCITNLLKRSKACPDGAIIEAQQFPFENPPRKFNVKTSEIDWCCGACILTDRSFFESIGGFDENIFLYCEDVELSWRAWVIGKKCYFCPEAIVAHMTKGHFEDSAFAAVSELGYMKGFYRSHLILNQKYFSTKRYKRLYEKHLKMFWQYPWGDVELKNKIFSEFEELRGKIKPIQNAERLPKQIAIRDIGLFHRQRYAW